MEKGAGGPISSAVLTTVLLLLASASLVPSEIEASAGPGTRDCGDVTNEDCRDFNNTTSGEPETDPLVPPAPSNLTWNLRWRGVELRWQNPEGAEEAGILAYMVYWGVEPDNMSQLEGVDPAFSFYYDESVLIWYFILQEPTTFYYQVTSINDTGESGPTNQVSVSLNISIEQLNALYINPPYELTAQAGPGHVNLSWSSPYAPGDPGIIGYRIYRSPYDVPASTNGSWYRPYLAEVPGTELTYTDTRVDGGHRYEYYVTAFTAVHESFSSERATVVVPDVPSHPSNTFAEGKGDRIKVSWSPPNDDGGSPVTAFRLYRAGGGADWALVAEIPADPLGLGKLVEYTDRDVKEGKVYEYRVSAVNEVGESEPGNAYPVEIVVPEGGDTMWVCLTFGCIIGIIFLVGLAWAVGRLRARDFPHRYLDESREQGRKGGGPPPARPGRPARKRVSPDELKPRKQ